MNRRHFLQLVAGAAGASVLSPRVLALPTENPEYAIHHHASWIMGQIAQIWIQGVSQNQAHEAINSAFASMRTLESRLSLFDPNSELHAFLQHPTGRAFRVSDAFAHSVTAAQAAWQQTGGNFDPTVRVDAPALGWDHVKLEGTLLTKSSQEFSLDFGGIGCGLALDRAAHALRACGIQRALLELSGDYLALEAPMGWEGWPLTAADPWTGEPTEATFDLRQAALATSSVVERREIWNPRTGQVADHVPQVTVMAPTATLADAWSTAGVVANWPFRPTAAAVVDWSGALTIL